MTGLRKKLSILADFVREDDALQAICTSVYEATHRWPRLTTCEKLLYFLIIYANV